MDLLSLSQVAQRLDLRVNKVRQLLRDGELVGLDQDGEVLVPAGFLTEEGTIVNHLSGVLTVLRDGGYSDAEAISWLHTPDDALPGTPVEALQEKRHHAVNRSAQALAF